MAWDKTKPDADNLLEDDASAIQANFEAIELGTDAALLITNAKVSPTAGIVDTKLAQITTAGKVSGTAITGLASVPSGAGQLPIANIPSIAGSKLTSLSGISAGAGVIPAANLPTDNVKLTGDQSVGGIKTFSSIPVLPATTPSADNQAAKKKYVDDAIAAAIGALGAFSPNPMTGENVSSGSVTFPNGLKIVWGTNASILHDNYITCTTGMTKIFTAFACL
jgi:hypothetical protein